MPFRNRPQPAAPPADPALLAEPAADVPEPEPVPLHGTPEDVPAPDRPTIGAVVDEVLRAVAATEREPSQVNVRFWGGGPEPAVVLMVAGQLSEREGRRIFRVLDADGAVLGQPYGKPPQQADLVRRVDQLGISLEVIVTDLGR